MLIISYDISNDKLRTKFSKYIKKFAHRLQYSVYEIKNSERILENITVMIDQQFSPYFTEADSIMIFNLSKQCKKTYFGYAKHKEEEVIFFSSAER